MVLAVSSRALVDACAERGVDVGPALRAVDLDMETLRNPDTYLPSEQVAALWKLAYELAGDPDLALHAAEALPFGAYKVVDFMAATAATVGDAFRKVSEYFPLINNAITLPIVDRGFEVSFGFEPRVATQEISRPYAEYGLAACYLRVRAAFGDFAPARVEFSHRKPPSTAEHERIFRAPVAFGCDGIRLVFSRRVWDQRNERPNPELGAILEDHARRLLAERPAGGFLGEVRKLTAGQLNGGTPTLEHVAKAMGIGARTLQRRLKDEGTSFAGLLDDLRAGMAREYLTDGQLSIADVGYLLGFSEQSAFHRAFRRWTGSSPLQYRKSRARSAP